MTSQLPHRFVQAVDAQLPNILSQDPELCATYGRDWTRAVLPDAAGVALPRSTEQVMALMQLCDAHGVSVVPSGGRTGLAGGAMAAHRELVVSLARMQRMDPVDVTGACVRVEAGCVTEAVHAHCAKHQLTWPVDFASKGSSQIGGNIATNAGGVKVVRYGLTRQWVLGLEVVLASGARLLMPGALEKNNTGLDLKQLFIGSEGTLGIITAATLKLVRLPQKLDVVLVCAPNLASVLALFSLVRRLPLVVCAFEFFDRASSARLQKHRNLSPPFAVQSPYYVLIELESAQPDVLGTLVDEAHKAGIITDGVVASSQSQARALWQLREGISESLSATGRPHKNDVALPIAKLTSFCAQLYQTFAKLYAEFEICLFGHIGDGNLHINIMKPDAMSIDAFMAHTKAADDVLFAIVASHQGSISAEHGVGLHKKDYLHYSRTPEELATMAAVKRALDPKGLLNPGKIFS